MKKKVFRERYTENVVNVKEYEELIENPTMEIKKEKTKRGKKNVKSDK